MPQSSVDLAGIFQTVTQALAENQQALNQADEYNQDHGDNMVQTFQTITGALEQKKGSSDSTALAYAAKQLSKNTTSSSGQLYAQNLAQAAGQFKGQKVDAQGALQLLQTLIGSGQGNQSAAQPAGGDMLGALLGGLTGGGAETPTQTTSQSSGGAQGGGDLLGTLLGGLTGGGSASANPAGGLGGQNGLGLDDLLNAGMAFMQARQSGGSSAQALIQALVAGSGMGNTADRNQSTQLVVNTFLQALSAYNKRQ